MTSSLFYLCAIPRVVWEDPGNSYGINIVQFVHDALGCERRIAKEINLENEFDRYTLTCQRLEQEVLRSGRLRQVGERTQFHATLESWGIPMQVLSADYLALLSRIESPDMWGRLGSSCFPPDGIAEHRHAFIAWTTKQGLGDNPVVVQRRQFYEWVEEAECGVVEMQTSFHAPNEYANEPTIQRYMRDTDESADYIEIPEFETTGLALEFFGEKGRKQHLAKILRQQIRDALLAGEPITFGNQAPHDVIVQVLHEFVFVSPDTIRPTELRVTYVDGSEAAPFPVFCLPRSDEAAGQETAIMPLRVALMSMRHLELDSAIDYCWFRNREVSRTRTLAETDQFCFNTTISQLRDSLSLGDLSVHLYQTGFEPAIVGFYRGLVKTLLESRKKDTGHRVSVLPLYFRGGENYQSGSYWR